MTVAVRRVSVLLHYGFWIGLALLTLAYLAYFADHAANLLGFTPPLDYGEGPLLAQVEQLRAGTPIWQLYADPQAPPYLVVNYPPVYLICSALLADLLGSTLLAGRLVALAATLGSVVALALLQLQVAGSVRRRWPALLALLFLTVPVVREWSVLMRVDLLGVCLGLWGLVVVSGGRRVDLAGGPAPLRAGLAALLLLLAIYTKPSLLAAPLAAGGWLAWQTLRAQPGRRAGPFSTLAAFSIVLSLGGGLLFALLEGASGGWFALHAVAANANRWEADLALGFWQEQLRLRWPLLPAALIGAGLLLRRYRHGADPVQRLWLPLLYLGGGTLTALGVGKVGAYSNYFIEFYAGLIWLAGVAVMLAFSLHRERRRWLTGVTPAVLALLLLASLCYYPPLWDANLLRPAGLVNPSPPRLAFGRYGLWADARREAALLEAQARVAEALTNEIRAMEGPILSDIPGPVIAAGGVSRWQVFEMRQLVDQGLADEQALLIELANGSLPLVLIDYLGNWLGSDLATIVERRYAQDGALGTFDRYRPVATGRLRNLELGFDLPGGGLELVGVRAGIAESLRIEPGAILPVMLEWVRPSGSLPASDLMVVLQLATPDGHPLLETERPLLYGAFPPQAWPVGNTDPASANHWCCRLRCRPANTCSSSGYVVPAAIQTRCSRCCRCECSCKVGATLLKPTGSCLVRSSGPGRPMAAWIGSACP
jgi:hypothetical protein